MRATVLAALGAALLAGCTLTLDPDSVEPPAGGPAIGLDPASLSFTAVANAPLPAAKTVSATNSGSGTLAAPTVSIEYASGSSWLGASVSGSSAPYTITVQPTTTALAPQAYAATVRVSSAGASNSPRSIAVSFTVTAVPPPPVGGCVASAGHQLCALTGSAGARAAVSSAAHEIRRGAVTSASAREITSTTHAIARGVVSPGASKP
jgi:hypothetical protein